MTVEEKIKQMGFELPEAPKPLAAYIPAMQVGQLVLTSGQIPVKDGQLKFKGKVGFDISVEEGAKAAELCALNCLSAIKGEIGDLDKIERIVKLTVFVNSADGFTAQPQVANGASNFVQEIFGDNGKHCRAAVGVNELPIDAAVEIEMVVQVKNN